MRGHTRTGLRIGAYVASGALAVSGITLAVAPAQAATDPVGVQTGSSWLVGQLHNGMLQSGYDDKGTWVLYDDQGLTIDAVESLVEADQQPAAVTSMTNALEADADTYASYGPGQAAKLLVLADIAGRDPATFGDDTLVQQVENQVDDTSGRKGALKNAYGSVLSQTFAARALTTAGSTKAADVTGYLLRQQCTSGFFRESFETGDDCVDGTSATSFDATAVAVIELASIPQTQVVSAALAKARTWLAGQQQSDGSWTTFGSGNANTTGLAARALGNSAAAAKAATWLYRHQARQGGPAPLATDVGAITVNDDAYDDAATFGLDERSSTTAARATAQSVSVLRWLPSSATGTLRLTGPTGYRKAGSSAAFVVSGTKAGHVLTLSGPRTLTRGTASTSTWRRAVKLPAGTATRTYTVSDNHGHRASRTVKVLGVRKLAVRTSKYRVKRSHVVTARVSGLARGERAAVYYKGRAVRRGVASSAGTFKATFRVGRAKGVKRISAIGAFRDIRHGSDTIRVVR